MDAGTDIIRLRCLPISCIMEIINGSNCTIRYQWDIKARPGLSRTFHRSPNPQLPRMPVRQWRVGFISVGIMPKHVLPGDDKFVEINISYLCVQRSGHRLGEREKLKAKGRDGGVQQNFPGT